MKKNLLISILSSISILTYSQIPVFNKASSYGGQSQDILTVSVKDSFDNTYLVGMFSDVADFNPNPNGTFTLTPHNAGDIYISKLNQNGQLIWAKNIGGNSSIVSYSACIDNLGNILVAGAFTDTIDFDPSNNTFNLIATGNSSSFILKLDSSGSFEWAFQTESSSFNFIKEIKSDNSGNVFALGQYSDSCDFNFDIGQNNIMSSNNSSTDLFLLKLNDNGSFLWSKSIGGPNNETAIRFYLDNLANIYVYGMFMHSTILDPSNSNLTTINDNTNTQVGLLSKYTSQGTYIKGYKLAGKINVNSGAIKSDSKGYLYITGVFQGEQDFDPDTTSKYLLNAGNTLSPFILKLDTSLNFKKAMFLKCTNFSYCSDIEFDKNNNFYMLGAFKGTIDTDPDSNSSSNLSSVGIADLYLIKLNENFKRLNHWNIKAPKNSIITRNVYLNQNASRLSIFGQFDTRCDFDPGPDSTFLVPQNMQDVFIAEFDMSFLNLPEIRFGKTYFYPNPSSGKLNLNTESNNVEIFIYDNNLKLVLHIKNYDSLSEIDISGFSNGIYHVTMQTDNEIIHDKIIKLGN